MLSHVRTSSDREILLDGTWKSGCASDLGRNLSEVFVFSDMTLVIDIEVYEDAECSRVIGTERIAIEFAIGDPISLNFDGRSVIANRISGTQTVKSKGRRSSFKQTFFVDDQGEHAKLYHARFPEDGGSLSSDGYPTDLIAVAIVKVQ